MLLSAARALHHIARPALRRTHLLATRSELEALTVPVLKDRLRSLSLKVGGKKGELVERLLENEQNGAAAAEAEPLVVDGVRVIVVGDDYDWGFDDDEEDDEDAGTDMADRLARLGRRRRARGARASHDEAAAPRILPSRSAPGSGGCGAPFQCQDEARTGYVPPSVYARLNLAGEDDDLPEAEVERLLAEARAGRQEAEVEVDEEDLAMDEEEFEACWRSRGGGARGGRGRGRAPLRARGSEAPAQRRAHLPAVPRAAAPEEGRRGDARAGRRDRRRATPEAFERLIIDEVRDRRGVVLLFVDFFDEGSLVLANLGRSGPQAARARRGEQVRPPAQ